MPTFRIKPTSGSTAREWVTVDAKSPAAAVQDYHYINLNAGWSHSIRLPVGNGKHEHVHFAAFEVEGDGNRLVSRVYEAKIARRGGVSRPGPTLDERKAKIAKAVGWTRPIDELFAPGWEGEEDEWK